MKIYMLFSLICSVALANGIVTLTPSHVKLGTVAKDQEVKRQVTMKALVDDARLLRLVSSCECMVLSTDVSLPHSMKTGESVALTVTVKPEDYDGTFKKQLFAQVESKSVGRTRLVKLTVSGQVGETDSDSEVTVIPDMEETVTPEPENSTIRQWNGETISSDTAQLILFLSPKCDKCRWVKHTWLPEQVAGGFNDRTLIVNIDQEKGLKQLLLIEKELSRALPVEEGQEAHSDAPIAAYGGKLYYGIEEIKQLHVAQPAK